MDLKKMVLVLVATVVTGHADLSVDGRTVRIDIGSAAATAAEPAKPPAGMPPAKANPSPMAWGASSPLDTISMGYVPQRAIDVAQRFLSLTPEQNRQLQDVRTEQQKERMEQMEQVEKQLDTKYLPKVTAILDDQQKVTFKTIDEAVAAYWATVKAAEAEFRALWEQATGEKMRFPPANVLQLAMNLPNLQPAERETVQRLQGEYFKQIQEERTRAMEAAGLKANDFTPESRQKMQAVQMEAEKKVQADLAAKLRAAFGDTPSGKSLDQLLKGLQTFDAKKKGAADALVGKLKPLVSMDRISGDASGGIMQTRPLAPGSNRAE